MQDFSPIREQLAQRRAELLERSGRVTSAIRRTNQPLDADFAEQAVQRENDEVLVVLDEHMRAEVEQIQNTLARLDSGAYGICSGCEEPIPLRRLEVLPYTSLCVRCAERRAGNGR